MERALLRLSWEAEIFGAGMFEALADKHPEHGERLTACATMEWFNARYCEPFGRNAGMRVTAERTAKLVRWGAALARRLPTFNSVARLMIIETPMANALYRRLAKGASTPELEALANDLYEHESAMRDWFRSELRGKPDGGEKIFAYLERHGVGNKEAAILRKSTK